MNETNQIYLFINFVQLFNCSIYIKLLYLYYNFIILKYLNFFNLAFKQIFCIIEKKAESYCMAYIQLKKILMLFLFYLFHLILNI